MWSRVSIDNTNAADQEGRNTALSLDNLTFAIGATDFSSSIGRVRIYRYINQTWDLIGTITGNYPGYHWDSGERIGSSISLSSDGNTIVIGAVGPIVPTDPYTYTNQGSIRVYTYANNIWALRQPILYGDYANSGNNLSVSISSDGTIISANFASYIKVFKYTNNYWAQLFTRTITEFYDNISALSGTGERLIYNSGSQVLVFQGVEGEVTVEENITLSGNIIPYTNNSGSLGTSNMKWGNAYIRDLSVANISVNGSINPTTGGTGNIGQPGNRWGTAFINDINATNLSVTNINGQAYSATTTIANGSITQDKLSSQLVAKLAYYDLLLGIVPGWYGDITITNFKWPGNSGSFISISFYDGDSTHLVASRTLAENTHIQQNSSYTMQIPITSRLVSHTSTLRLVMVIGSPGQGYPGSVVGIPVTSNNFSFTGNLSTTAYLTIPSPYPVNISIDYEVKLGL